MATLTYSASALASALRNGTGRPGAARRPGVIINPGQSFGSIDPTQFSAVALGIVNVPVRNDGQIPGWLVPRVAIRERSSLTFKENEIIVLEHTTAGKDSPDITAVRNPTAQPTFVGTFDEYAALTAPDPWTSIRFDATPVQIQPGEDLSSFDPPWALWVGTRILAGKTDLDVIVRIERLDTLGQVAETRYTDAFSVVGATGAFEPVQLGDIALDIAPIPAGGGGEFAV